MQLEIDLTICITGGANPHNWVDRDSSLSIINWSVKNFASLLKKNFRGSHDLVLLVHPLMEKKYFFSVLLARISGAKIIFFYESTKLSSQSSNFFVLLVKRVYFSLADRVITVGKRSTENVKSFGFDHSRIIETFNAVDPVEICSFATHQNVASKRHGHRFLFVGQFIDRKNIESLIHAFVKIREPNDSLTLIGSGHLQEYLEELVRMLDLQKSIVFLGYLDQTETYQQYFRHDTLILPSKEEVWGLVANEALSSGMHVVVTEVSGVCDLIAGFEGVYVCSIDSESISLSMLHSARDWRGRIQSPDILRFGTSYLAERFIQEISAISRQEIS